MITELKTFIAVCKYGTFAAAGDRIGLSQSAVSSQIKRLEDNLGFKLFDRTGRSATLNTSGQKTLGRAGELCALYEKLGAPSDVESTNSLLRIGAVASAQSTLVARALGKLRRSHPQGRVHVTLGGSMELMDYLDAGRIDAAVMVRPPFGMPSDMTWQTLVLEPFALLLPRREPPFRDWKKAIQNQPFLRYDRASFGGRMVERFLREERLAVNDAIEVDEIPALVHLVAEGLGVALVPLVEAHLPLPDDVHVMSLGKATFYRETGLLRRRVGDSPPIVQHFSRFLKDIAEVAAQSPIPVKTFASKTREAKVGAADR